MVDKIYESLQLYADYEESYKIFQAAKPDPDLQRKMAEEKSSKEALAKQLKQDEQLQKQAAKAAFKVNKE